MTNDPTNNPARRLLLLFGVLLFSSGLFFATGTATAQEFPVSFTNIASMVGLSDPTVYGEIDRKRYIIETNGCGVAFVDYDHDGLVDLFMLSGTRAYEQVVSKQGKWRLC